MKGHEVMDYIQRKINSILFRLVMVGYSFLIIYVHKDLFPILAYVGVTILYLFLFVKLDKKDKLRLLNDFLFVNFILWGKDPSQILIFTLIILPIINSINFSGTKKSIALYIYTTITYITLIFYHNKKADTDFILNSLLPLVSILFLWIINGYTELRLKIRIFREELNATVDNFYLKKEEIKRPHKIYKELIKVIHNNTKKIKIDDIICFTIHSNKSDKLVITNGSSFIWSFSIKEENIIEEIRNKKSIVNINLTLDGIEKRNNLLIYSKVENQEYIYVIITEKTLPFYYLLIGFFNRTLEPAFKKISNILLSEKRLQDFRNEEINRLSERSQYVNRANKTMHYIRNRLGPFSNLIKMLEKFDSVTEEKKSSFRELIFKEAETARNELNNITERANNMLEKSNNPFVYTKLDDISIERVFTILKRNVYSFFPNIEIDVSIDIIEEKQFVKLNEEGFELFLSDWLNNMLKYSREFVECKFIVSETTLEINFINDHKLSKQDLDKLINDLMSDDRNEIMRRTTHGLYTIKLTLEDMNIPYQALAADNDTKLVIKLLLKTLRYEHCSI